MTWTKLGDEYGDQCWKLSDAAFRLHTEALVWSNRRHLDGRLNKDEMRQWTKRIDAADELVRFGFWSDEGDHFQIVAHLGWQRTAAEWLHQSEVNKANQAKRKARRGKNSDKSSDRPPNESLNEPLNESLNERFNERDRTGQDRTGSLQDATKSEKRCRFCDAELPEHMPSQRLRGYCSQSSCYAEARAEMAG